MNIKAIIITPFVFLFSMSVTNINAQVKQETFIIENYYKVKWGYAEEFINLWKINHYPLLKKSLEKGDIVSVTAEKPKLHGSEDARWDFKVTIHFKNSEIAFNHDLLTPYKKTLYPDADKLAKDEQHRFSLLLAHWDVLVDKIEL